MSTITTVISRGRDLPLDVALEDPALCGILGLRPGALYFSRLFSLAFSLFALICFSSRKLNLIGVPE